MSPQRFREGVKRRVAQIEASPSQPATINRVFILMELEMDEQTFLPCKIAQHRLAFPLAQVLGVQPSLILSELPGAPVAVSGVVSVRGMIVPVVDLALVLGCQSPVPRLWQPWLRVRSSRRELFVPVDEVGALFSATADAYLTAQDPQLASGRIAGAVRLHGGLLLIHDVELLLDAASESSLDKALLEYEG